MKSEYMILKFSFLKTISFRAHPSTAIIKRLALYSSDDLPKPKPTELLRKDVETVQEYSASEEREEGRRWRLFRVGDQDHRVDMKAIEPYKKVISHGGKCYFL